MELRVLELAHPTVVPPWRDEGGELYVYDFQSYTLGVRKVIRYPENVCMLKTFGHWEIEARKTLETRG